MGLTSDKTNSTPKPGTLLRQRLPQVIYLVVIALLIWFLATLGMKPWRYAMANWSVLLLVMVSIGLGVVIQAKSFTQVGTAETPGLLRVTVIWSASSVISVVAPLFAGITTRTAMLVQAGMSFSSCMLASLRQVWMGLEYAFLMGCISLPFTSWPFSSWAAIGSGAAWVLVVAIRLMAAGGQSGLLGEEADAGKVARAINSLRSPVPWKAHPWFVLQVLAMSAAYYIVFNGMGAELGITQAIALSSLTVVLSLIVFVPNGLGITDALWVIVASDSGLSLEQSVALAIIMRLAHLLVSALIYLVASAAWKRTFR
jgi:uncharacterized membrane protein YbhN (UPF0104 family)